MTRTRPLLTPLVAALGVAIGLACDGRLARAPRIADVERPPTWLEPACQPAPPRSMPSLPANRYWQCDVRQFLAQSEDAWRRRGSPAGQSLWGFEDQARRYAFQHAVAAALDGVAIPLHCTRPVPDARIDMWQVDSQARFWAFPLEGRWVYMRAFVSSDWEQAFGGIVVVRTGRGVLDSCADSLRLRPRYVM